MNPLLIDLYQLTMMQAYFAEGMQKQAVFECFIRKLPKNRQFFIAAGLEQVLDYLEQIRFSTEDIDYLRSLKLFSEDFLNYLKVFRFEGDVNALPEGTIFFPHEPIIQIVAPLDQAQLVESCVVNYLHFQTNIASKAIRCRLVAPNQKLIEFGMRRAHSPEASLYAARASYIAGFDATATVEAGQKFSIPVVGTMSHSYIQAHDSEEQAFLSFANVFPEHCIFLIDTYDIEKAAIKVARIAHQLKEQGVHVKGVRIDSGYLAEQACKVRTILDDANLQEMMIYASGNLDEYKVQSLNEACAPINAFGIGTHLTTAKDTPVLDCVYKLQAYNRIPKRKYSQSKVTLPGQKQIYRCFDKNGFMQEDILALYHEKYQSSKGLLVPVMQRGKRLFARESLIRIQERVKLNLKTLPESYTSINESLNYSVKISSQLQRLIEKMNHDIKT